MNLNDLKRVALATTLGLAFAAAATGASAAIADYEFRLVRTEFQTGDAAVVDVTLVDKRSGKPVPGAVIFAKRLDMAPDGMAGMTSAVEPMPSPEPGVYRFEAKLVMVGGWRLSLGAKVQGETGTLESKLAFKAIT